jgi:HEAT repeat protein
MSVRSLSTALFSQLMFTAFCLAGDAAPTFDGKTAAQWIEQLKDKNAEARAAAAVALGKAGPKLPATIQPLILAAADKEPEVRMAAALALARFPKDADKVVPAITRCLKDKDVKVRVTAVVALATIAPSASKLAVPSLAGALRNEDMRVRMLAAEVLADLKADAVVAAPALIDCLGDKPIVGMVDGKEFVLDPAASSRRALIEIGEPAIPALLRAIKVRGDASRILGGMVARATADDGKMSPAVATIIPALIQALMNGEGMNDDVYGGLKTGITMGGPSAVPALTAALKQSKHPFLAAGLLAQEEMQGLPVVIAALKDKNLKVRGAAAAGIGSIELRAKRVLDTADPSKDTPRVKWAQQVRDEALPEMIRLLKDTDRGLRVNCTYILGELGALDATVVPALVATFKEKDADVQKAAISSLVKIKNDAAMLGLIEAYRSKDNGVRSEAAKALSRLDRSAIPILTKALDDADPAVAKLAASILKNFKGN